MATSSRRSPATRRFPPYAGSPACSGVIRARRELRKSRISARRSIVDMSPTLGRAGGGEGGPGSTRNDCDSHTGPHHGGLDDMRATYLYGAGDVRVTDVPD